MESRRPSFVALIAGAAVCAAAVSWLFVEHLGAVPAQRLVDLDVYRGAGRAVLHGADLYRFVGHAPQRLPFTYPPFAALLAVPLAWMSFGVAGWMWSVGEVALTVVIAWLAFRRLWPRCGRWWPLALGVLAGAMQQMLPLRDEIKFGQVDELLVAICAVDLLLLSRARTHGMLVGLATAIKLTPGVFVVYLLVTGRRRAAAVAAGTFTAATLLAAGLLPGDSKSFWTDALWHSERLRSNSNTSNQSLRGMWLRAVSDPHVATGLWIASAVVVAIVGFRRAARAHAAGDELLGVALTGLLAVLLSPVAWIHHLCWLPLLLGALVADGRNRRRLLAAAFVFAFYVVKVPWIGAHLLNSAAPTPLARVVEDGYGLMAIVLLVVVRPTSFQQMFTHLAPTVTVRHTESRIPGGAT
ncbi:MAG TPA: glycosyltransferase 87 family protein [Mycobacteriales bacterium]|nr:glycosyltransferase 87 family protein [Mycobacteriales bacterium]